jgi:hypothetical protein
MRDKANSFLNEEGLEGASLVSIIYVFLACSHPT